MLYEKISICDRVKNTSKVLGIAKKIFGNQPSFPFTTDITGQAQPAWF